MKIKASYNSVHKKMFGLNPSQNPAAHPGMGKSKGKGGTYTQNSKGRHPKVKMVGKGKTNEDLGKV